MKHLSMNFTKANKVAIIVLILGCYSSVSAQDLDSMMWNGKQYYIYPFKQSVAVHRDYYRVMKGIGIKMYSYRAYLELMEDDEERFMSRREYKKFMRSMVRFDGSDDRKHIKSRKFKKAVRANPYPMLEQRYSMNSDVVPALDPIPNGEYIQLYESVCIMDSKGECNHVDTNFIAGFFSMKNNTLHGEAVWINFQGDTLKHGWFEDGLKTGQWMLDRRRLAYALSERDVDLYIERGYPKMDTTIEYITYARGVQNGSYRKFEQSAYPVEEGHYINGEPSGEWMYRDVKSTGFGASFRRDRNNELVTRHFTYENEDSLIVRFPWIRNGLIRVYTDEENGEFDFFPIYSLREPPRSLYTINFKQEPNLELDEEFQAAEHEYGEYNDYGYDYEMDRVMNEMEYWGEDTYSYSSQKVRIWDPTSEEYIDRSKLIDSIGLIARYEGIMEEYYPNGQLAFRYEFENGVLKVEDTVFWDNGNAHDVIEFIADSNHYLRTIYDYNGNKYISFSYDSLGQFQEVKEELAQHKTIFLDGYKVDRNDYSNYYFYNANDTLAAELTEPLTIYRSWCRKDSSFVYHSQYDPVNRVLTESTHGVTGYECRRAELTFAEDYESWTGKQRMSIADLELFSTSSGALYDYEEEFKDSIPQRNVRFYRDRFDVSSVHQLHKNGVPYTGPVKLNFDSKKIKFSSKGINLGLPQRYYTYKKLEKNLEQYRKNGKTNFREVFDFIDANETNNNVGYTVYRALFDRILGRNFAVPSGYYYGDDYYFEEERKKKRDKPRKAKEPYLVRIEGQMVEGRPHGYWAAYDQYGQVMTEMTFDQGELNGQLREYDMAFPNDETEYYWIEQRQPWEDSIPAKKVHYLSSIVNYENDQRHGQEIDYNWLGQIVSQTEYKEGYRDGEHIDRNRLVFTKLRYKLGFLDGYVQTYLTLPDQDSMLLYDLNFQNGSLNGESKAYHTNGKLAKRGFFLDGQPIEDYESYDTLGFKYHYVKFKYSFPVEEKIWEENALSVRYLFDWEDSIHFVPSDITSSQSLDRIIYNLGLGDHHLSQPYYGRPSLVNKDNIRYHMTKYYPNDTISRDGSIENGKKTGCWRYYNYKGDLLYEVDYFDTILTINDSIRFRSKGILTDFDTDGSILYHSHIIEKFEKYDCAHTDHYEIRQLYTVWEADDSLGRMNGFVRNFYDNGTLQSEGEMNDGLPTGFWKIYDPYGKLNQYGQYIQGKRNGRWLSGDLSKTKYLGDICLNPNLPDLEDEIRYRENLLDITITNYQLGKALNRQYYDVDMNHFKTLEEDEEEHHEKE